MIERLARLLILDPGHFHAALVQKQSYEEVESLVSVYAPLGAELFDYLNRIYLFNSRSEDPTSWRLNVYCNGDSLGRVLSQKPGNVVVLAGKNDRKIDYILGCVGAGMNVLADKPWIISSADLPKLEESLRIADQQGLIAYDIMTERYEVTSQIQRELVNMPEVFGTLEKGSQAQPAVYVRSVHNIMKLVSGIPLRRPAWFFDTNIQGEALADVGTHVVDLVQWTAFPDQAIDFRSDVEILDASRWPLLISAAQFEMVTGESAFLRAIESQVAGGKLQYFCNNSIAYTLRGVHIKLDITWDWEATQGAGDIYEASFRGTKARIEVRQGASEKYRPELYVVPNTPGLSESASTALRTAIESLQPRWPGLDVAERNGEARLLIPDRFRVGHEAHFAQVTRQFFEYLREPSLMPSWETPNMLAKYFVTTRGVEQAAQASTI